MLVEDRVAGEVVPAAVVRAAAVGPSADGEVIVVPRDEAALSVLETLGYSIKRRLSPLNAVLLAVPVGKTTEEAVAELAVRADLVDVRRNRLYSRAVTPNDPQFSNQWQFDSIVAEPAWDIDTGTASETIAIIDDGIDTDHVDLAARLVFVKGADVVNNDDDPSQFVNIHGTEVAGMAAAITNNGQDAAGVDWNAKIMPIQVFADVAGSSATSADIAAGIIKAVENHASVINLSLMGFLDFAPDDTIEDAIAYAVNAGIPVVAAAGNFNSGGTTWPETVPIHRFPGSSFLTISVGATNRADSWANFSAYVRPDEASYQTWINPGGTLLGDLGIQEGQLTTLDLVAPGESVVTLTAGVGVATVNGTSFSAPLVFGAVTLVKHIRSEYSPENLREILRVTARDIGPGGYDAPTGAGVLDLNKLLGTALYESLYPFSDDTRTIRADSFSAAVPGDTGNALSAANGRVGRRSLEITGNNVYTGYDGALGAESGTIEFYVWFDATQPNDTAYVVTQKGNLAKGGGSLDLIYRSDGHLEYRLADTVTLVSADTLFAQRWYHVAMTYGDSGAFLYVNGESQASSGVTGGPPVQDTVFFGAPGSVGSSAVCRIDSLRFSRGQRLIFPSALAVTVWSQKATTNALDAVSVRWTALRNETSPVTISIYADENREGFDGIPLATGLANDGQETVSLAALASTGKEYFLYVTAEDLVYGNESVSAYSDTAFKAFTALSDLLTATPGRSGECRLATVTGARGVKWLRWFRDRAMSLPFGRWLVGFYYRVWGC